MGALAGQEHGRNQALASHLGRPSRPGQVRGKQSSTPRAASWYGRFRPLSDSSSCRSASAVSILSCFSFCHLSQSPATASSARRTHRISTGTHTTRSERFSRRIVHVVYTVGSFLLFRTTCFLHRVDVDLQARGRVSQSETLDSSCLGWRGGLRCCQTSFEKDGDGQGGLNSIAVSDSMFNLRR